MNNLEVMRYYVPVLLISLALLGLFLNKEKSRSLIRETFLNIGIFLGLQVILFFFKDTQAALYLGANEISYFNFSESLPLFLLTFFLVDLIYYWVHRISHSYGFMWAIHSVHHSSKEFNFSTALRLPWLAPLLNWVFFIPLVLIGLPLKFVVISHLANLWFQYFIHTKMIGKLGVLDLILNSPSNHRVHHSSQSEYIDKNFGGVFMLWDHIFKTYKSESTVSHYGVSGNFKEGHNPLEVNIAPWKDYFGK